MADIVGPSVLPLHCPTCLLAAASPDDASQDSGVWNGRQADAQTAAALSQLQTPTSRTSHSAASCGFLQHAEMI